MYGVHAVALVASDVVTSCHISIMLRVTLHTIQHARLPYGIALHLHRCQSTRPYPQSPSQADEGSIHSDPYPLPLSSPILAAHLPDTLDPCPPRIQRHNESTQALRARLTYQSRKRGTLEADLLLSTFAGDHLRAMEMPELHEFDRVGAVACRGRSMS